MTVIQVDTCITIVSNAEQHIGNNLFCTTLKPLTRMVTKLLWWDVGIVMVLRL